MKAIAFLSLLAASAFGQLPETVYLLKPVSVMSDSGISRFEALKFYRVVKEDGDNYVLENDRKVQFIAAKSDVTADAELIAPAPTPAPVAAAPAPARAPAQVQTVANVAPSPRPAAQQDPNAERAAKKVEAIKKIAEMEKRISQLTADIKKGGGRKSSPENKRRFEERASLHIEIKSLRAEMAHY